ncbi:hypothetical protein TSACC_22987 [Terrimicrobium sacchariphilum]|uniref:Uncharacterized protein n=1 Tax=Terrimicrobium sacchariphilum TaxID=690879 RepID=A0A146GBJ0_TERSA|nr:hypothetical protein TSACC_22987 [Terrimicrobium sacchariphilum]
MPAPPAPGVTPQQLPVTERRKTFRSSPSRNFLYSSHEDENQDNNQNQSQPPTRIISPAGTMRPRRQRSNQEQDQDDKQQCTHAGISHGTPFPGRTRRTSPLVSGSQQRHLKNSCLSRLGTGHPVEGHPIICRKEDVNFVRIRTLKRHPSIFRHAIRQRSPSRHAKLSTRADLLQRFSKSTYDLISRRPTIEKRAVQSRLHAIRLNKLKEKQTSQHNPNRAIHHP